MSSSRTTYVRLVDNSLGTELSALVDIYSLAIQRHEECQAKKKASRPGGPDAGKEINERSGKVIIPK